VLVLALLVSAAGAAGAGGTEALWSEFRAPEGRFGLAGASSPAVLPAAEEAAASASRGPSGPTPFLAGLMSAVVPGTGQLAQGQSRGWIYLGVEVAAWFSYFALRDAAKSSEDDFKEFADGHWTWDRYETVTECGEGLGPRNFDEESARLQDLYDNSRDDYYVEIGRDDVYACGWDSQNNRADYEGKRDNADDLYSASGYAVGVIVVNHIVASVDAARSASRRRTAEASHAWNWQVTPDPRGVDMRVELSRTF
jgi:hypothetical protein